MAPPFLFSIITHNNPSDWMIRCQIVHLIPYRCVPIDGCRPAVPGRVICFGFILAKCPFAVDILCQSVLLTLKLHGHALGVWDNVLLDDFPRQITHFFKHSGRKGKTSVLIIIDRADIPESVFEIQRFIHAAVMPIAIPCGDIGDRLFIVKPDVHDITPPHSTNSFIVMPSCGSLESYRSTGVQ